jgi:hypothetical protein
MKKSLGKVIGTDKNVDKVGIKSHGRGRDKRALSVSMGRKGLGRTAAKPISTKLLKKPIAEYKITPLHDDSRYSATKSGLLVPRSAMDTVKPDAMKKGIKIASEKIREMLNEFKSILTTDYGISEIKITASFDAEGKFLGFGVGGAASIEVTIKPM